MSNSFSVKRPLFVPHWIKTIMERHQLPLTKVTDLVALRQVTSLEDLILTYRLNSNLVPVLGYVSGESCILSHWLDGRDESMVIYNQLLDLLCLHEDGLEARLYNEAAREPRFKNPYEIIDISSDVFLVVIYPGFFGGALACDYQKALVTDYLKQWYGYNNYDTIAQSQFFEQYLKQL